MGTWEHHNAEMGTCGRGDMLVRLGPGHRVGGGLMIVQTPHAPPSRGTKWLPERTRRPLEQPPTRQPPEERL